MGGKLEGRRVLSFKLTVTKAQGSPRLVRKGGTKESQALVLGLQHHLLITLDISCPATKWCHAHWLR